MRVLAEIPAPASPALPAGTLRRCDLAAFGELLEELRGSRVVLTTGDARRKRSLAVGLAAAAAAGGVRTALLECDLAAPSLAEALGLATAPGLHEYLRGEAVASAVVKPVALAGPGSAAASEPLVCVVAGRPAADGSALLGSEAFRHAIAKLGSAYELLVAEGPSASDASGLAVAAGEADATLACVGSSDGVPSLPVQVTGLVMQGEP